MRFLLSTVFCVLIFIVIMVAGILVSGAVGIFISAFFVDVSRDLSRVLISVILAFGIGGSLALCVKIGRRIMRFFIDWSI